MTLTLTPDANTANAQPRKAARSAQAPNPQAATAPAPLLERAKPISICFGDAARLDYFLYVPANATADSPVVAAIHGLRRSAAQQIFQLKAEADASGMIVFAPLFSRAQFRHFQTLSVNERGKYPEDAFDTALADALARLELADPKLYLFGFSGGAQFAHRYVMRGRRRFDKMALVAPGWFTMPHDDLPFPFGCDASDELGERVLDLEAALACPTLVVVGERDTKRSASLNQDPLIDGSQGKNRLARCQSWVSAMQAKPDSGAIDDLLMVKGGGHNLESMIQRRGMGKTIFAWFAG